MKNITSHIGILRVIKRLPSSVNGNPRYLLRVDGWTCRTSVDSSLGYSVTNYDGKMVRATIGTHYGSATLDSVSALSAAELEMIQRKADDYETARKLGGMPE